MYLLSQRADGWMGFQSICKRTGSRLGVCSRKGKGATFWIEMMYPVATEEQVGPILAVVLCD